MQARDTLRLDTSAESIRRAAVLLREGGLVAMPTETVYGLAADALNAAAVLSIFAAKGRPHWDPLIVHVASRAMLEAVTDHLSGPAEALARAFWPGPLTLLLPRSPCVTDVVTAGRPLVGVRWPVHPVAQALILESGRPLAAPSANRFGRTSPSAAAHVLADLHGRIDAVIDAGATQIGLESTVLDPNTRPITVYRQGAVRVAEIERVTGVRAVVFQAGRRRLPQSLPSPGLGIRHYAPQTPVELVASRDALQQRLSALRGARAVLLPSDWVLTGTAKPVRWAPWDDSAGLARELYAALHRADALRTDLVLVPLPELRAGDDLRAAVRDRLLQAAMPPEAEEPEAARSQVGS